MSTLHCFMKGTLTNPLGSEVEVWVNVLRVTSITQDSDGGSHILLGEDSTGLHVHESPTELLSTATYITPTTQESMPIYFGDEN